MKAALQTRTTTDATPSFTPVRSGVLQRKCACGGTPGPSGACAECQRKRLPSTPTRVQTRLTVNQPGDRYEQEADAVAKQVVRQQRTARRGEAPQPATFPSALPVQRMIQRAETSFPSDAEEKVKEEGVQRKGDTPAAATPGLEARLHTLAGSGRPLPETVHGRMEESFGANFEQIRIHDDAEAATLSRSIHAEAFTYGNDIYFGANKFDPATEQGTELLAHELTHTLQQKGIRRKTIQRRGGTKVGELSIRSNVISAGLTAGHAWLAYLPVSGSMTTYGTWGNLTPKGLYRDRELTYTAAAIRTTNLDSTDHTNLTSFAAANADWGYINNCASFAARGWRNVTGESLAYKSGFIPNPSALGAGIVAANGGATGTLPTTTPATGGSSGGSSSSAP